MRRRNWKLFHFKIWRNTQHNKDTQTTNKDRFIFRKEWEIEIRGLIDEERRKKRSKKEKNKEIYWFLTQENKRKKKEMIDDFIGNWRENNCWIIDPLKRWESLKEGFK